MPIHPTAIVDRNAEIDPSVEVGANCVIEGHVRVAAGCRLYHNVYLTGWTQIGEDCVLHPGVIVGHEPQDVKYGGERSFCRIGKRNILREYVTIHRGTVPESVTAVGDDCFFLAGSHVGHNCTVGNRVTLINNVLLGGHITVEDRVTLGGGAAVHQFCRVGELAMITGTARIAMDILPFSLVDAEGRIAGLNSVGLRRSGMPKEHVLELRRAFHTLFGRRGDEEATRGASFQEAVKRFATTVESPPTGRLLAFLQAESKRGIAGRTRTGLRAAPSARPAG